MASKKRPVAPHRDQERGGVALLIVDMMNLFDFGGGAKLQPKARRLIGPILKLRAQMDSADAPVIYVNDNFGEWHSEKSQLVERARAKDRKIVSKLAPRDEDYFVIKPQFSGFYATNLPLLLPKLGVSRLVLTGIAADICILFTAADAHMRDYALWVPADAVAAERNDRARAALAVMADHLGSETASTDELGLAGWTAALDKKGIR